MEKRKVFQGLRYVEYRSESFDKKKKYPLLLFLHGSGERGDDLEKMFVYGPLKEAKKKPLPFVILAPQCAEGRVWYDYLQTLGRLFDKYTKKKWINEKQTYVTGMSMGGYGTWAFAMAHADRLAAIVPICGGGLVWNVETLKNLPVWAFHNVGDSIVDVGESRRMVTALQSCTQTEVKYTEYPLQSHDAWSRTYADPNVYEWLLSKSL